MDSEIIKVNFGCFTSNAEGWINIDNALRHIIVARIPGLAKLLRFLKLLDENMYKAHRQGKFRHVTYGDVRKRLRFADSSVDYIYASHLLEHLYYSEAQHFLNECYRILKDGGRMRIAIPDLETATRNYVRALQKDNIPKEVTEELVTLFFSKNKREFLKYGHRWMYDWTSLKHYLSEANFKQIKQCSFREGRIPDLEKIENRPKSLFVEAVKL